MKFSSACGTKRSRGSLFAILALAATVGLYGCEGDGGPSGPGDSTGGSGGQTGPTGPTGPTDVPITLGGPVRDMLNGSKLSAQDIADIGKLVVELDSATVTGNKPVIEFTVKTSHDGPVLGLAASTLRLGIAKLVPESAGFPSRWQSYINRAGTPSPSTASPALSSAIQANVESGATAGWQELGDGRYRYTATTILGSTPIAVTYEPALTHRVSLALDLNYSEATRALAPENPYLDFVPAGGSVQDEKRVATTANCAGCHVGFAEHGGPRRSLEYCVVCHNAGSTDPDSGESVDMAYMAHSIHLGSDRSPEYVVYGFGGEKFSTADIEYPQPVTFCETCHTADPSVTPQGDNWRLRASAAACGACHVSGLNRSTYDATTGRYTYTYTHPLDVAEGLVANDGDCVACHKPGGSAGDVRDVHRKPDSDRARIEQGQQFKYEIVSIENAVAGQPPKVTFRISDANGNALDATCTTTTGCTSGKTGLPGRLRLDFAWTGKDIHNVADIAAGTLASARGTALTANFDSDRSALVDNGNGTYSYTLAQPLPSGFSDATLGTGLMVVLEGRRELSGGARAYPNSAVAFAGGPARPELVVQAKCENCHKKLSAHGGSRAGNPLVCTACHNSSAGGTWGTTTIGPLAMGAFVHGLHKAADDAETYPQSLARCEACHASAKVYMARPEALPITVNANTTASTGADTLIWTDDTADSATAGTCKGCHDSGEAITHMTQQGGYFGQPKLLTPSSSVEGCALCHGAGQTFDVAREHCSALPYGQCSN